MDVERRRLPHECTPWRRRLRRCGWWKAPRSPQTDRDAETADLRPGREIARFDAARERAIAQLAALEEETQERLGQEQALLFQIHQMMLEDLDYRESVTGIISGQLMNAEYAVDQTAAQFSQIFAQMDDAYMQQRASDVLDVSRRLISVLMGREEAGWAGDEPVILAADDLVPSETARLDRQRVLAFVTAQGTGSSHTAIFARTMGIPAVVGLGDALLPGL